MFSCLDGGEVFSISSKGLAEWDFIFYCSFCLDAKRTNPEVSGQNDLLGITHGFLMFKSEFVNASHFAKAPFANTSCLEYYNHLIISILDLFSKQ